MAENAPTSTETPAAVKSPLGLPVKPAVKSFTPFAFTLHGSRAAVLAKLDELVTPGRDSDQTQLTNAKALAIAEIDSVPESVGSVKLILEGRAHENSRQISVIVLPDRNLLG